GFLSQHYNYENNFIFFFQAEDGIRVFHVTGVQTCALPIWARRSMTRCDWRSVFSAASRSPAATAFRAFLIAVRTVVRRLMLRARRSSAWRARLRADLMLAM